MELNRFSRQGQADTGPNGYYSSYGDFRPQGYLNLEERIFLFCELLKKNQPHGESAFSIEPEDTSPKPRKKKVEPGGPAGHGPHLPVG